MLTTQNKNIKILIYTVVVIVVANNLRPRVSCGCVTAFLYIKDKNSCERKM